MSILIGQILGLRSIFNNEHWPILFFIPVGVAVFQVVCLPLCADSPQYLYSKGKIDETRKCISIPYVNTHVDISSVDNFKRTNDFAALVWLRGTNDVDDELDEIAAMKAASDAGGTVSMTDMFTKKQLRTPLLIASMIFMGQQLSGISAVSCI